MDRVVPYYFKFDVSVNMLVAGGGLVAIEGWCGPSFSPFAFEATQNLYNLLGHFSGHKNLK